MDALHYRHEHKHVLSLLDVVPLRSRLRAGLRPDTEATPDGKYLVHSLYFDTPDDRALGDKLDGVARREKYRLRYYRDNYDLIRLEKKVKHQGMTAKVQASLTIAEARRLVAGDVDWLFDSPAALLRQFYLAWRTDLLRPKVVLEYDREAYTFPAGNVRVTIDTNVRATAGSLDLFDQVEPRIPVLAPNQAILEVKCDDFLPDLVRDLVQVGNCSTTAASKYALGRRYR